MKIFLRFPDRETALAIASALIGEEVENMHPDGWWTDPETGDAIYWNLDDIGVLSMLGETDGVLTATPLPGYHINGIWHSELPLPAALAAFQIFPENPQRTWA